LPNPKFHAAWLFFSALACLVSSQARGQAGAIPVWQPPKTGLGYEIDLDKPGEQRPGPLRAAEVEARGAQPLYARVHFSWSRIESERGVFRFEELESTVGRFRDAGFDVILTPVGGNPLYGGAELPLPPQVEYLTAWRAFLRKVAETFRGKVRFYQIGDNADLAGTLGSGAGPKEFAFLIKNGAVEIRGADPEALIVLGSVGIRRLDLLEKILQEDLGPYLDAVPLRGELGLDPAAALDQAGTLLLHHLPAASLWLVAQPLPEAPAAAPAGPVPPAAGTEEQLAPSPANEAPGSAPVATETAAPAAGAAAPVAEPPRPARDREASLIETYLGALTSGSKLTLFELRPEASGGPESSLLCVLLRRLFPPTVGPAPEGTAKIRFGAPAAERTPAVKAWKFFDASTFQVLLAYRSEQNPPVSSTTSLLLDTADVTGAALDDLLANTEKPLPDLAPDAQTNTTRLTVPLAATPLILRYQRFATPGYLRNPKAVDVGGKHEITAEEIIAHHQEFQADQDSRLRTLWATAKIRYLYKVASADVSVDVTTFNNFYWDPKTGGEWEQTDFFFNGVRWTGKKLPDLPLIQPEKVIILPLNINLNKDYAYRYAGTDTADGRDCYVLDFTPVTPGKSLYQGKVWIDRKTFARVRIASVQTGLEPPVTSNDERDQYGPAPGAGERPLWVLQRIEGQQIWNISGVNLVVQREIEFSDFALNAADFEARRAAAHQSAHVMLRDTEKGFRYLDRSGSGERVVREGVTKRTLLGAAGVFYEQDLDFPVPLAGIDYFDFNFKNTGSQVNFFFAGALLQASIQSPRFLGSRLDAGASVLGVAFSGTDNYYLGERKLEEEEVRQRSQSALVNLGIPMGNFLKLKLLGMGEFAQFGGGKHTESFRVPRDTSIAGYGASGEFNRWGVTAQAHWERHRRERWDPWGDTDPASVAVGTRLIDFDPTQRSYSTAGALLAKQFILPVFQKLSLRAEYLTGKDQDRFSKFSFGFFGNRVRGFSGSGVKFDRALLTSVTYGFNFAEALRLEGTIDYARVRDSTLIDLSPPFPAPSEVSCLGCDQNFAGLGIAGNVMGPWSTLLRFDWGIAVKSDIPGLAGRQEAQVTLLKFF
jgi:hypothetical protein